MRKVKKGFIGLIPNKNFHDIKIGDLYFPIDSKINTRNIRRDQEVYNILLEKRKNGELIVEFECDGKPYIPSNRKSRFKPAIAPYNFVSLNEKVVITEAPKRRDKNSGKTGYIELKIENEGPFFIRKDKSDPEFFTAGDRTAIPGASMRGLTHTMVEMISWSAMGFLDREKRLFYRNIGDNNYQSQVTGKDGLKAKAGWLYQTKKNQFVMCKVSATAQQSSYYRVKGEFRGNRFLVGYGKREVTCEIFKQKNISFDENSIVVEGISNLEIVKALKSGHDAENESPNWKKGVLLASGPFGRGRRGKKHQFIVPSEHESLDDGQDVSAAMERYAEDQNIEKDANLLEKLKVGGDPIACFYLEDKNGKVETIGHTAIFRLPYKYTVGEHLPISHAEHAKSLADDKLEDHLKPTDYAEAIFGNKDRWAGRVFFEDCFSKELIKAQVAQRTKPLNTPKPTTFQHYLVAKNGDQQDWNAHAALLSGYKNFWHRQTSSNAEHSYSWAATDAEYNERPRIHSDPIRVVEKGSCFTGRIRFENLREEELGALLMALKLPEGCRHKLGLAKPLGLGTVHVTPTLYLMDRKKRYKTLFSGDSDSWNTGLSPEGDIEHFQNKFAKDILDKIEKSSLYKEEKHSENIANFWTKTRLKGLFVMLQYDENKHKSAEWLEKTRYQEIDVFDPKSDKKINEYDKRPLLPTPENYEEA